MTLTVRNEQMQEMGDARPNEPVVQPCDPHWIEFELVDAEGNPVPGEPFRIRLPDQSLRTGTTDRDGKVRFDSIIAGEGKVCYTGHDLKEWRPA